MPPNAEPALFAPRGRPPKTPPPLPPILLPPQSSPHSSVPSSKKSPFAPPPHAIPLALTRLLPICQIFPLAKSGGDLCNMYDCLRIPARMYLLFVCMFMNTYSVCFVIASIVYVIL
jgi:hypothetical protein